VRILVDGNNLMHAVREIGDEVGPSAVCRLLGDFAEATGLAVTVVFDGGGPSGRLAEQIHDPRIAVCYGGPRQADDVLEELIAAHTAPRRLTVVSSDREVRRMATRRQCRSVKADLFARRLLAPPPPAPEPVEPPGKRQGLSAEQTRQWLEEFGIHDDRENL
jgi:predicted RNA-binding protein with PIN domain